MFWEGVILLNLLFVFYFDQVYSFGQFTPCVLTCMFTTTVKPIPRRADVACYNETYQRKLEMFTKRVSVSNALIYTMYCQILWINYTEC